MTHTEKVALAMAWYDSGLEDRAAFQTLMESLFVQPEQEPVAWQFFQGGKWHNGMEFHDHRKHTIAAGTPVRDLYTSPPQRTEQEPVAIKRMKEWVEYLKRKSDHGQHMKIPSEMSAGACWELAIELEQFINTTPPQRKPLTDDLYNELLFAVGNKCPNETRHQTALRYILQAEKGDEKAAHGIKGDA